MILALGIIIGLLIAIFTGICVAVFAPEPRKIARTIRNTLKPQETGAIISAPNDDRYALEKKFQSDEDIRLDDL